MKMKKNYLAQLLATGLLLFSFATQAITLSIDPGSNWCADVSPGFGCLDLSTPIVNNDGIRIGEIQSASGSHVGPPDGSEVTGIDQPWSFFGNTGMHLTTSPVNILSQGTNTMALDFTGWAITWNGVSVIPLGTGSWSWSSHADGVANINCAVDCQNGDSYTLWYTATVPAGDPSGFGGVQYALNLTGTISAVPIPGAFWLFLSGLAGLTGMVRKQKNFKRNLV